MDRIIYDIIVVGAGPAGMTAALYTSRAKLRTVILEKQWPGGQLLKTDVIENYPGFKTIKGPELAKKIEDQLRGTGVEFRTGNAVEIRPIDSEWLVRTEDGAEYQAPAIIYCAGGSPRKLGVPGEAEFAGRGVSYCAVCDGPLFRDRVIAVVGGGDSAVGEGVMLARYASKVHILNNDDELEASPLLQERALATPQIEIHFNSLVQQIGGDDRVRWVKIKDPTDGSIRTMELDGVFIYVGFKPNSELLRGIARLDQRGYVVTDWEMSTSAPGIFAAGDVTAFTVRQITNAAGDATTAAVRAYAYLQERGATRVPVARRASPVRAKASMRRKRAA